MNICVKNKVNGNDGRVLIIEATIDGYDYFLISLYNANTEKEQLTTIKNLNNLLKDFENFYDKMVIFAGDFNLIFDKNFESAVWIPPLKKHSLSEIMKLLIYVIFGGYVIPTKNYSFSDKNISPVLYNEDLIIFFFLTLYKNQ